MRNDANTALAFYSSSNVEIDDELDLVVDEEQEVCPGCGAELVELDADPFALHCPVCDRHYR
jgi:transcription initiation factor IIE alpha subunit